MLNKSLIYRKISLIQDSLANLEQLAKFSLDEIAADFYKLNTLERLLEKIIMRAIDINQHVILELSEKKSRLPVTYKETFTRLADFKIYSQKFGEKISKSVGTRNVLVHEYDDNQLDYEKVYSSIKDCLKDYGKYCQAILDFLQNKI